jgi:hypothetical protein
MDAVGSNANFSSKVRVDIKSGIKRNYWRSKLKAVFR